MPHPAAALAVLKPLTAGQAVLIALLLAPAIAFAAPGEPPHPSDLADLVARRQWPLIAAGVVWTIVRVLQKDTRLPDQLNIPGDYRPLVAIVLSAVSGAMEHALQDVPWRDALTGAAVTMIMADGFQNVVVRSLIQGVLQRLFKFEIPMSAPLAKPATIPPSAGQALAATPTPPPESGARPAEGGIDVVMADEPEDSSRTTREDPSRPKREETDPNQPAVRRNESKE